VEHGSHEVHGPLDSARAFAESEVSLPIHPFLRKEEVDRVVSAVCAWTG
jgi:dTDP-4-amino-4,6-dideoxygalactose transaminase